MRNVAWFVVGWLFAYQTTNMFPSTDGPTSILTSFILDPIRFLEGAVFILASFLIFSYTIRYAIHSLVHYPSTKRRTAILYGMIGTILVLLAWGILIYESIYIAMVIIILSLIHLNLSMERMKKVTHKER